MDPYGAWEEWRLRGRVLPRPTFQDGGSVETDTNGPCLMQPQRGEVALLTKPHNRKASPAVSLLLTPDGESSASDNLQALYVTTEAHNKRHTAFGIPLTAPDPDISNIHGSHRWTLLPPPQHGLTQTYVSVQQMARLQ
ncbi:Hypothetical predicted protein [Pelobates cultripes]|uniref:Uncharacterized protein n=1 Tax=Pelobates cultripes TaxID=61616 RepID=A0AAD1RR68_PELCU|nr:Hypothetical predicted protein [Pelobates cultripes]